MASSKKSDKKKEGENILQRLEDEQFAHFEEERKDKWKRGRIKYRALGRVEYTEDSIVMMQEEMLDIANYAMAFYFELDVIRARIDSITDGINSVLDGAQLGLERGD